MSLSTSSQTGAVTIRQENGSQVSFWPISGGGYTAPARVIARLTQNPAGSYTFLRRARTSFTFNSSGQLTAERDLNGYLTAVTYPNANTEVITDPAGRALTLTFSGGHLASATDPLARVVTFGYNDSAGNLTGC
jgi:YD repeat-containing protein